MPRKKKNVSEDQGAGWLATYADMVTLLLTFFAVLLSMSTTDEAKFNAFIKSFSSLPQEVIEEITGSNSTVEGAETVAIANNMDELYQALKTHINENNQGAYISISKINDVIYIRFSSALFFEPDQYVLRRSSLPTLDFIGNGLKKYQDSIRMVNVLGFTATVDYGTYWMLSAERSAVVATHFNYSCGLDPSKLTVIGYGNQYPVATNETEEGRKQNRRVELIIVGDTVKQFDLQEALGEYYDEDTYPVEGNPHEPYLPNSESQQFAGSNPMIEETPQGLVEKGVSPYEE